MGHALEFLHYNVDSAMTPKLLEKITADASKWAYNNGDLRENPNPSCGRLRVLDQIFPNENALVEYFYSLPNYSHVAARYYCANVSKADAQKAYEQLQEHRRKVAQFVEENQVWHRTSEFIGCPGCNSKLSRVQLQKLHTSTCPLCSKTLLSPTIQKRLQGYAEKRRELEEKLQKINMGTPSNKTNWLVRCEVHC